MGRNWLSRVAAKVAVIWHSTIATLGSASLVSLMYFTPQTTGQMEIHAYISPSLKPYITRIQEKIDSPNQPALLIMDKFRGQMNALEDNKILVVAVPDGTTDKLQPLDLSVNEAAEDFLQECFRHQYSQQVMKQLKDHEDPKNIQVNMSTAVMRELSAQWLTAALYDNFRGRPELISNGFKEAGIAAALEDQDQSAELSDGDPFADLD